MKFDTNKLNVGKKQWIAIAVIAVVGIGLGSAILGGKTDKSAEGREPQNHVEAKAHSDGEHHGKTNDAQTPTGRQRPCGWRAP